MVRESLCGTHVHIMANHAGFVLTLDDDDPVPDEEADTDEEERRSIASTRRRKQTHEAKAFNADFQFSIGETDFTSDTWAIGADVREAAKGKTSIRNLDENIRQRIADRKAKIEARRKKKQKKEEGKGEEKRAENSKEESGEDDDEEEEEEEDADSDDMIDDSSDDETDSETEAEKAAYFEAPPPLVEMNFTDMNLSRPLLKAITSAGFTHPTPVQAAAIPVALAGKDLCASAATGTGKTAAFILPVLERLLFRPKNAAVTRVLVLVPTRELAVQVHAVGNTLAKGTGVQFCLATGGMDLRRQEAELRRRPDIIIATPGRIIDHLRNTPSIDLQTIEILIIDEADRILDENFEDQLNELIRLTPRNRQTMLFSATMTDEVKELARLSLNQPVRLFVDSNTDVADNLQQEFLRIRASREADREAIITALCCRSFNDRCLVFLPTKWQAHRLRIVLGLLGLSVGELHGSLSQAQRLEALHKFKENEISILTATDLAARGLDIIGVKTVINYSMPSTFKRYIHRVGRTARAGRWGRAVTLVGEKDRKLLKEIVKKAKVPVKSRIVAPEVILKYKQKVNQLESDVKVLLKQEAEEKEMKFAEMEVSKAKNLIEHKEEISRRPQRTWFESSQQKRKANVLANGLPESKKTQLDKKRRLANGIQKSHDDKEQSNLRRSMEYQARQAKRAKRKRRLNAMPDETPNSNSILVQPKRKKKTSTEVGGGKSFERELTNTSKKMMKGLSKRTSSTIKTAKGKPGKFKSKKRYKRR
ncbi:probable ATP-dependent RNA helicase DDX27 [Oscarella lobularis]|uniref:probable ATP-dependent RNA helicase DDX27 n=1 Tax=Oscarella lobularis TaxID=121494 RepID=UPI003313CB69